MSKPEFLLNGIELRDYLAAHAPPCPDWYRHQSVEPYPEHLSADDQKAWQLRRRAHKFFEWRWFYADAMMASRGDPTTGATHEQ